MQINTNNIYNNIENFSLREQVIISVNKMYQSDHVVISLTARVIGCAALPIAAVGDVFLHVSITLGKTVTGLAACPWNVIVLVAGKEGWQISPHLQLPSALIHLMKVIEAVITMPVLSVLYLSSPKRALDFIGGRRLAEEQLKTALENFQKMETQLKSLKEEKENLQKNASLGNPNRLQELEEEIKTLTAQKNNQGKEFKKQLAEQVQAKQQTLSNSISVDPPTSPQPSVPPPHPPPPPPAKPASSSNFAPLKRKHSAPADPSSLPENNFVKELTKEINNSSSQSIQRSSSEVFNLKKTQTNSQPQNSFEKIKSASTSSLNQEKSQNNLLGELQSMFARLPKDRDGQPNSQNVSKAFLTPINHSTQQNPFPSSKNENLQDTLRIAIASSLDKRRLRIESGSKESETEIDSKLEWV